MAPKPAVLIAHDPTALLDSALSRSRRRKKVDTFSAPTAPMLAWLRSLQSCGGGILTALFQLCGWRCMFVGPFLEHCVHRQEGLALAMTAWESSKRL